jgi:hypothetical protein
MLSVSEYCLKYPETFTFASEEISDEEIEDFIYEFIIKYFHQSEHTKQLIDITKIKWKNPKYRANIEAIYKNYRKYYSVSYRNEGHNKTKFDIFLLRLSV